VLAAAEDANVAVHVIGRPAVSAQFSTLTDESGGAFHNIGDGTGSLIGSALSSISFTLTESTPKPRTDEPEVHSGIHAGEVVPLNLASDVRPGVLGIATGKVTTKDFANEFLVDIDDALVTVNRYLTDAGAMVNRLTVAQAVQGAATLSTEATVQRMEQADMFRETGELMRNRIRAEAANASLTRLYRYQRSIAASLLSLVGGRIKARG